MIHRNWPRAPGEAGRERGPQFNYENDSPRPSQTRGLARSGMWWVRFAECDAGGASCGCQIYGQRVAVFLVQVPRFGSPTCELGSSECELQSSRCAARVAACGVRSEGCISEFCQRAASLSPAAVRDEVLARVKVSRTPAPTRGLVKCKKIGPELVVPRGRWQTGEACGRLLGQPRGHHPGRGGSGRGERPIPPRSGDRPSSKRVRSSSPSSPSWSRQWTPRSTPTRSPWRPRQGPSLGHRGRHRPAL